MLRKISMINIFIISFVIVIYSVKAAGAGIGGGSYVPNPGNGGGNYSSTYVPSTIPVAFGYRVSVVKKDGTFAPGTYSHDYWSSWGKKYGMYEKVGYSYLTKKLKKGITYAPKWLYYETPRPKTQSKATLRSGDSKIISDYWNYATKENYIDKKSFKFTTNCNGSKYNFSQSSLTSGGCMYGGDKRIGNNYSRLALETFTEEIKNEKYDFLINMLKNCGFKGKDSDILVASKDYYLIVEPLTAIYATDGITFDSIALGTSSDLKAMGVIDKYNDYVYDYFMYINPVIYNTFSGGPLNACKKADVSKESVGSMTGCAGAFTMYIGDVVEDSCSDNATKIVNDYFTSGSLKSGKTEQDYLRALYEDELTNKCVTKNGSTYTLKDTCNVLDPLSLKSFKGIGASNACSAVDCGKQLNNGVLKKYTSSSDIESLSSKLFDYWKDRSKEYLLLQKEMYDLLNDGTPSCGTKDYECEPVVGKISNCDANVTLTDSNSNDCWAKGIAYNNIKNKSDYKAYESSKDVTLSTVYGSKCDVYCIESVTFNLPKDSSLNAYGTKAGRVFKWGINTDTNDSLYGEMSVTRTCQPIGSSCSSEKINPAYWVKDRIDTLISLTYKEPVSGREIGSADLKTTFKNFAVTVNNVKTNNLTDENYSIKTKKKFKVQASYKFDYSDSLHWYSDKSIDDRYVTKDSIDDVTNPKYLEIGYGLPTDFTSPTVTYSIWKDETTGYNWEDITKSNKGYMYATIKNIGTKNNDGSHHFDKLIKTYSSDIGFNSDGTLRYSCDFNITNELFGTECVGNGDTPNYCNTDTSPKGLDVVFRTIDLIDVNSSDMVEQLNRAFPGRSGVSRDIGKNWAEWLNGNPDDPTDTTNIYKILSDDVYDKKPLYTIKLNVSTIRKIRKYNSVARKIHDPYTYMGDDDGISTNGYIGYKCVKGSGKFAYCASEFLTELKNDSNIKYDGECAINTNGSTIKRAQNFSKKICG